LLAELRGADVRSILDVVVNHPGRGSRVVSERPDWFHAVEGCELLGPAEIFCPLNGHRQARPARVFRRSLAAGRRRGAGPSLHRRRGLQRRRPSENPGIAAEDRAAWPDGTVLHEVAGLGAPATARVEGGRIRVEMPGKSAAIYLP
jgi:hypothetical protein